MANPRVSKIRHRQVLTVVFPGELGYAKDVRRLFIGKKSVCRWRRGNITTVSVAGMNAQYIYS